MTQIDNIFKLKAEAAAHKKKANHKCDHSNKKNGESKGEQKKKNPCRKHK